jgi:hypothetical protein
MRSIGTPPQRVAVSQVSTNCVLDQIDADPSCASSISKSSDHRGDVVGLLTPTSAEEPLSRRSHQSRQHETLRSCARGSCDHEVYIK